MIDSSRCIGDQSLERMPVFAFPGNQGINSGLSGTVLCPINEIVFCKAVRIECRRLCEGGQNGTER